MFLVRVDRFMFVIVVGGGVVGDLVGFVVVFYGWGVCFV